MSFGIMAIIVVLGCLGYFGIARPKRKALPQSSIRRTSWKIICYACTEVRKQPAPDCGECRSARMMPLSKYQAEGGGTGFWIDPQGPFVASLCEGAWTPSDDTTNRPKGDRHAPLFDLDYPAELHESGRGCTLVLHRRVHIAHAQAVIEWMEAQDLSPFGSADEFQREHSMADDEGHFYRMSEWLSVLEIPLAVPAKLLPSRTAEHFHLYLETVVIWEQYVELMRRMADAGLIEQDWYQMNLRRRMAMLRKPPSVLIA